MRAQQTAVRVMLLVVMLIGLVFSVKELRRSSIELMPMQGREVVTIIDESVPSKPVEVVVPKSVPAPAPTRLQPQNLFPGASLYVDPYSEAARQAALWQEMRPADAAVMAKLAAQPVARWFGDWNTALEKEVSTYVSQAAAASALPVVLAYNIPLRDCGQYSRGGAANAEAYREWVQALVRGIGGRRVVVVVEPDAVGGMDCLNDGEKRQRAALLTYAVDLIGRQPRTSVYLDAGNPVWLKPEVAAERLKLSGIASARGFVLNSTHFVPTQQNVDYGHQLSKLVGNKPFIINTSRNGVPLDSQEWCNPAGRAVGPLPSTNSGYRLVDALLWLKAAGESDGACNGGPPAGQWWPEYALDMARRAGY